jgi:hypothetical protein
MYAVLLFLHFIGLGLGVGTGFANLTLGISLRNLPPEERAAVFLKTVAIAKNGSIGLALLILTGIGMTAYRGVPETFAWGGGAFHAKLTLVLVFCGVYGYLQMLLKRVKKEGGGPTMAKLPKLGQILILLSLGIVGCAVAAFH